MNRLQKKCFIASAGFHLTLLLILFVGSAFLSKKNPADNMPVLDVIPSKAVDAAMSGGGNPAVKLPPPTPIQEPQTEPPKPTPQPEVVKVPVKEIQKPEPQKIEKLEIKPPVSKEINPLAETKQHKIEVSTKIIKRTDVKPTTNQSKQTDNSEAIARERAAQQLAANLRNSARNLRNGLSSPTTVEVPGPGGEAYANYEQIVKSIYTQAWVIPDDVTDDEATAKVSVVIARDGTVISARITQGSGNAAADKSVQATLNRIKFVKEFPEGTKDKERKFNLSFNVKAKRLLG